MNRKPLLLRMVIGAARGLRAGWLMAGAVILTIGLLEGAYRAQLAFRYGSLASTDEPASPFEQLPWARDYWIGHQLEEATRWEPYTYLRNPTFSAPHATVDESGHRITPVTVPPNAASRVVRVFFLGGSTTFGWYQRAPYTFPAEGARRVQALLGSAGRVEVVNFGVPGRTSTQEVIDLMLALRTGHRPDIVVFLDGINDVMATVQNGTGGFPQNEWNREADFVRGQRVRAAASWRNDLRAAGGALADMASRLQLLGRLKVAARNDAGPGPEALARSLVNSYVGNVRLVESLAAGYGFVPLYVWQPALLSTGKPLTQREAWLNQRDESSIASMRAVHRGVPPLLGPAVAPVAGRRFLDATHLFDSDRQEVFVDLFGHTYERANPVLVDALAPALTNAVEKILAAGETNPD